MVTRDPPKRKLFYLSVEEEEEEKARDVFRRCGSAACVHPRARARAALTICRIHGTRSAIHSSTLSISTREFRSFAAACFFQRGVVLGTVRCRTLDDARTIEHTVKREIIVRAAN